MPPMREQTRPATSTACVPDCPLPLVAFEGVVLPPLVVNPDWPVPPVVCVPFEPVVPLVPLVPLLPLVPLVPVVPEAAVGVGLLLLFPCEVVGVGVVGRLATQFTPVELVKVPTGATNWA